MAQKTRPYKIISFYTPNSHYAVHVQDLKASLDRFSIPYEIYLCEGKTTWEHICAYKATFIYEKWKESNCPVVWLDCDATVEKAPVLFGEINADFAVHKWEGWRFASGTIYFDKTPVAEKLLQQWILRCEADPTTWDQVLLQSAWCDIACDTELKTYWLPRSYLQIFDGVTEEEPVIRHWQASRQSRREGHMTDAAFASDPTPFGIEIRRPNKPWRTVEESFWIQEGVKNIKPETGHEYPEGNYVEEALRKAIGLDYPVLEVGCGVGRIASLFKPREYIGVDINPCALVAARQALPNHVFHLTDKGLLLPKSKSAFFYTVLLHVPDEDLGEAFAGLSQDCRRVVIAEVMDSRWRREGNPPVFNRDPETYILEMQRQGFVFVDCQKYPYERYDREPWNIGHDSRLTILTFERR